MSFRPRGERQRGRSAPPKKLTRPGTYMATGSLIAAAVIAQVVSPSPFIVIGAGHPSTNIFEPICCFYCAWSDQASRAAHGSITLLSRLGPLARTFSSSPGAADVDSGVSVMKGKTQRVGNKAKGAKSLNPMTFPLHFHYEDVLYEDLLLKLNYPNIMEVRGLFGIRLVPIQNLPRISNSNLGNWPWTSSAPAMHTSTLAPAPEKRKVVLERRCISQAKHYPTARM